MKNTKNSPLNSEGGKYGQRDPGTGYSQKEKLSNRAGHSKAVSEGYHKALPLIGGVVGAITPIPGGMIAGALGKTLRTSARNFSSAVKQYVGKGKKITTPRDAVLDAKGMLKAKTSLKQAVDKAYQKQGGLYGAAKTSRMRKGGITKPSQREMLHGKPRYPSSRNLMKSSKNVTPTGADPRSRIYGEHASPKGEALGSYQYRSSGFGGGGRVWEPTKKSARKLTKKEMQKNLDAPSGYYRSDAKGWPLPISSGKMERKKRVMEILQRHMKK